GRGSCLGGLSAAEGGRQRTGLVGGVLKGSVDRRFDLKYGLIAGNGQFPFLVLEAARSQGLDIAVAAIKEETAPEIDGQAAVVEWMGVGQLGRLIRFFKREQVSHAIMAGQVKHHQIFRLNALPDLRMARLLSRLPLKNTGTLINAVADELAKEG